MTTLAMRVHRARRRTTWAGQRWSGRVVFARDRSAAQLPVRVKQHGSRLPRELDADQMHPQHDKVTNLRLAAARMDGLLIRPGETFSFNRVVGNCTPSKGYANGMRLSDGSTESGVGGGICQLADLVHWMVLHAPLTVLERSEHSFDPFPDRGRVLPWGVGCSIVYNHVDLVVRNDSERTFQLAVKVGTRYLSGQLLADESTDFTYRVEARDEQFLRRDGQVFRRNEIWRRVVDRASGIQVGEQHLTSNCALVHEPAADVEVLDL